MEGRSHDSTPCTDCRSFRSSICSSPPVFPGIETFFPVSNHRSSGCPERNPSGFLARQVYYLYASPLDQPPIDVRSEVETIHEAFAEAWVFAKGFESTFKHTSWVVVSNIFQMGWNHQLASILIIYNFFCNKLNWSLPSLPHVLSWQNKHQVY